MLALFVLSSLEGWPDLMYQGIDATAVEVGPQKNSNIFQGLFFVSFILIGVFFFLNFFVGVIFLNFEEAQKEERDSFFLNDKQLKWLDIMKMIINAKPDIETIHLPKNK
jgi:cbb3-type cytochrome oxidase subunit 3